MTIWIAQELPLCNIERLDILCAWIEHPSEKLWPFEFLDSFRCSIVSVSIYYVLELYIRVKMITIWISEEPPLFNFERLDIFCALIRHPSEELWQFEFLVSFRCSISSISIYNVPESDIHVKSHDHLNFSKASVVQFRVAQYTISQNCTSVWKLITIWISRELPLLNFECLDTLCAWIRHLSEMLWPFEFLKRLRCSISSVSINYAP